MISTEQDTLQDTYTTPKWSDVEKTRFPYKHSRPLPQDVAHEAIVYINVIAKQYPFQLRYVMVLPHWKRFAQEWCDSGDVKKALRVI